jgi:hypothetical protein
MTRVLHRISRGACPAADRPWLDALFAELDAIEPGRARFVWLLGALGLVANRYLRRLSVLVTPAWLAWLIAALVFTWFGLIEFEGLTAEDDWNQVFAAAAFAAWFGVSVLNLRRRVADNWP